jgi:hypothetical protein
MHFKALNVQFEKKLQQLKTSLIRTHLEIHFMAAAVSGSRP